MVIGECNKIGSRIDFERLYGGGVMIYVDLAVKSLYGLLSASGEVLVILLKFS